VAAIGKNLTKERYKIVNELWDKGVKAEILYNENPRMDKQMDYACDNRIPFIIFIGENEVKEKKIKVKCMANASEVLFTRDNYIEEILKLRMDPSLLIIENKPKNK
jgi:histidyl-tRNA synthetase